MYRVARLATTIGWLLGAVLAPACNGSNNATVPTPDPVLSTEPFTGTLAPLGTASHQFTVTYSAAYTPASITVSSLTSVATGAAQSITIGIAFGSANLGVCTRSEGFTNAAAPLNTELQTNGSPFIAGTYCLEVFDNPDAPTVSEPLNYSVTLKHY